MLVLLLLSLPLLLLTLPLLLLTYCCCGAWCIIHDVGVADLVANTVLAFVLFLFFALLFVLLLSLSLLFVLVQ